MFKDVHEFYLKAETHIKELDAFVQKYGLKNAVVADHICYKCSSPQNFDAMRRIFESSGWLYQTIISNRRIATIRTVENLTTSVGDLTLVELSDQKPDGSQTDGFDHVEIYPVSLSYEQLVSDLRYQGLEVKEVFRPHHTTHDIRLESGFAIKLTRESLAQKIKKEQL